MYHIIYGSTHDNIIDLGLARLTGNTNISGREHHLLVKYRNSFFVKKLFKFAKFLKNHLLAKSFPMPNCKRWEYLIIKLKRLFKGILEIFKIAISRKN